MITQTSPTSIQFFSDINFLVEGFLKQHSKDNFVLDVGTAHRYSKEMSLAKEYFKKKNYFALGYNPSIEFGKNSCDLNADIHKLPIKTASADSAICLEVIEHVYNPQKAVNELFRILKPGGQLLLTTPFLLSFHGRGKDFNNPDNNFYPDFWRFTHQGLQFLCRKFTKVDVYPFCSTLDFYLITFLKLIKFPTQLIKPLLSITKLFQAKKKGSATHRHLVIATK